MSESVCHLWKEVQLEPSCVTRISDGELNRILRDHLFISIVSVQKCMVQLCNKKDMNSTQSLKYSLPITLENKTEKEVQKSPRLVFVTLGIQASSWKHVRCE